MNTYINHDEDLFYLKTYESDVVKHLFEVISCNLCVDMVTWKITHEGIHISSISADNTMIVDLHLDSKNFSTYTLKNPLTIGIPIYDLRVITKNIKSRSMIQIYIKSDLHVKPHIYFDIGNKGGIVRSVSVTTDVQVLELSVDTSFTAFHVISSIEFYKICKTIKKLDDNLVLVSHPSKLEIHVVSPSGTEMNLSYLDSHRHVIRSSGIIEPISLTHINTLCKLGKLSSIIRVYLSGSNFLKFETSIGVLGTITLCMRTR